MKTRGARRVYLALSALVILGSGPITSATTIKKMIADLELPYVYAVASGGSAAEDTLLFIDVESEAVVKAMPIGTIVTDMSINYGEKKLYVTNWQHPTIRVVDLMTQTEVSPLYLGVEVYKINAGRPGRIYFERDNQSSRIFIINSENGVLLSSLAVQQGDGEIDPTGRFYYHCDASYSSPCITKFDLSTDSLVCLATSESHKPGSRNLVLSGDGSRLFWMGFVYDADLTEIGSLGSEIYATTLHGDLAFGSSCVFNAHSGDTVYTLPVTTSILTVSGDQEKLFLYNPTSHAIETIPMADIADNPGLASSPAPADGETVALPVTSLSWHNSPRAIRYDVYFGEDEAAVASADTTSPEYLGSVVKDSIPLSQPLDLGQTYYWRVDPIGVDQMATGNVWTFTAAPILVSPNRLFLTTACGARDPRPIIVLTAQNEARPWSVSASSPWLEIDKESGQTPDTITATFRIEGLAAGEYRDSLHFVSDGHEFNIPVKLKLFDMNLTKMVTDFDRPYIYGLDSGRGGGDDALLLFINSQTELIEKVIPIGSHPTDMSINYGEAKLYVTNWLHENTRIVDLTTQTEVSRLRLGTDVYRIEAGRPGRICYENSNQWIGIHIVNSETGEQLASVTTWEGDSEIDPTGHYYYHCSNGTLDPRITKFDISTDNLLPVASSPKLSRGSRNLVLSGDGSRLFWRGHVYDSDLNELGDLGSEIYAATLHGNLACGSNSVFNAQTGHVVYTLPDTSSILAVSGDQEKMFLFNKVARKIEVLPMSDIAPIPAPPTNPVPADGATEILPLTWLSWDIVPIADYYNVYLGEDRAAVESADQNSPEFLGSVVEDSIALPQPPALGKTYYWRADPIGFTGSTTGRVWSFAVAPIIVAPRTIKLIMVIGGPDADLGLSLTSNGSPEPWEISESMSWLDPGHSSGVTPDSVDLVLSTDGLEPGVYSDTLWVISGDCRLAVPIEMDLVTMDLTKMVTDYERPYIYGLQPGSEGLDDALLLFINTQSDQVEKVIPIGSDPTDMSINYGEGKLYVSNWHRDTTRVVDLATREEVAPLRLGTDVYRINAGRPGRIYYENATQRYIHVINTETGEQVGSVSVPPGDGEVGPLGNFYYHCDSNRCCAQISKFDISTDSPVLVATSYERPSISRNLVLSGDESRLFWRGFVYDANLNELRILGSEIYATTAYGELAFGSSSVYDSYTGAVVYTLPVTSTVLAVSGDQKKLFLFDGESGQIETIKMSDITDLPVPGADPSPADGETIILPLSALSWKRSPLEISYDVYFGEDEAAVATADLQSTEYLGRTAEDSISLPQPLGLGRSYYWRVDLVGSNWTTTGNVWSFTTAPIQVSPTRFDLRVVTGGPDQQMNLILTSGNSPAPWSVSESIPWLELNHYSGQTPATIVASLHFDGMPAGAYSDSLRFTSGDCDFAVPVRLELFDLNLTKMVTDFERPYIYGLDPGHGDVNDASLLFINTLTERIEKIIPIGSNPTDMSIDYGQGRLYVTNWQREKTRIVDLTTREELPPLLLGRDVYKLNAGRAGRLYYENEDQWINIHVVNSETGAEITHRSAREGDAEVDATGNFYYHCDNNISNAHITKFDISTDSPTSTAVSAEHPFGSRNLILSRDGSRLFWRGYVYDADLNELRNLDNEIYATTLHGDLAFASFVVFNTVTGGEIAILPYITTILAVSGDQSKLFMFNPSTRAIDVMPMSDLARVTGRCEVVPHTLSATTEIALDPIEVKVYVGDFDNGFTAADVSLPTVRVNGIGTPTNSAVLTDIPGFSGPVLKLWVPVSEFLAGYGTLWDQEEHPVTISGKFNNTTLFKATGSCYLMGHVSHDLNGDGEVNVLDVVLLIDRVFKSALPPEPDSAADIDCNGELNIGDVVSLISHVFRGAAIPDCPADR